MTVVPDASDAATARRSHSIGSALTGAVTTWFALLGGIGAWTVHLVLLASIVQLSCDRPGYLWVMHGATAATLSITAAAAAFARRLARRPGDPASSDDSGRDRFVGQLGLLIAAFSAVLIVVEEVLVIVFRANPCG
jgi:hypothetical protein